MRYVKTRVSMLVIFILPLSASALFPVSVNDAGVIGNGNSLEGITTSDGRYVLFSSSASNLVPGDTNNQFDIFVRDIDLGTTIRASVSSAGVQANNSSSGGLISSNGRYVYFTSLASNLVAGDTNNQFDVFMRDTVAGTTTRVSVSSTGLQANGSSNAASITPDGRYVLFTSLASNLVAGDTNNQQDVFVRDTVAGTTTRVSVSSTGLQANALSSVGAITPNGRYVLFNSSASNLVPGDTNTFTDMFVRDTVMGTTTRVSVSNTGLQANFASFAGTITPNGRYVLFSSSASNLVAGDTNGQSDMFVRDTVIGTTTRITVSSAGLQANSSTNNGIMSSDGRYIYFTTNASNLVAGDTNSQFDVFVRDTTASTTTRISVSSTGLQGNNASFISTITPDGRYVLFNSSASNLVSGDTNGVSDLFMKDMISSTTTRVSLDYLDNQISGPFTILNPSISTQGDKITFLINKSIHPVDTNGGSRDVYRYDYPIEGLSYAVDGDGGGIYGVCELIPGFTDAVRSQSDADYSIFVNKNFVIEFDVYMDNDCHRTAVADFAPGSLSATLTFIDGMGPGDFTCGGVNYCSVFGGQSITNITEY